MYDIKLLTMGNIMLMVALAVVAFQFHQLKQNQGYFAQVPADQIHTMKVWEDGSFAIEYQDNTSEIGCIPGGLCND